MTLGDLLLTAVAAFCGTLPLLVVAYAFDRRLVRTEQQVDSLVTHGLCVAIDIENDLEPVRQPREIFH